MCPVQTVTYLSGRSFLGLPWGIVLVFVRI